MKDQELEKLMRQVAADASLDDRAADDIADSATLWWSVQRDIRNAAPSKAPWPPNVLRRWLMVAIPVAAVLLVGLAFYVNSVRVPSDDQAQNSRPDAGQTREQPVNTPPSTPDSTRVPAAILVATKDPSISPRPSKAIAKTRSLAVARSLTAKAPVRSSTEIKSEFIALAYAPSPESGQLVRVRVPSSMMVSLGVVPTVNDPSKLIDAEVLVGDDGLTQAIRFIRQ